MGPVAVDYLAELGADEIATAARHHHALWGGERSLDDHIAMVRRQIARSAGHMRYAGLRDDNGELVSSLKRYRLRLVWGDDPVEAVGIGAVYTPERVRGHGYARRLIERLLDEARSDGVGAALLFSDIDPGYYERLGFVTLSHLSWSTHVDALPVGPSLLGEPIEDPAQICALFEESWSQGWIRSERDARAFGYWSWRNGTERPRALADDGAIRGYLCSHHRDGVLWVDDAATLALAPERLWATLGELARSLGAQRVGGWLRPEHAGGPFVAAARSRCIPMVARLDATLPEATRLRSHFSSVDHF